MRLAVVLLCLALIAACPSRAETVPGLLTAAPSVTGTGEAERLRGFRVALKDVVVKLTGDASLAASPRIAGLIDGAPGFVSSYSYEDEMKGIPIHDEQGTRDRPHKLTVTFDAGKLTAALKDLGLPLWPADRPRTAFFLAIRDARASYVLRAEGPEAYGQREVIRYVANQRGLPVVLPPDPAALGLSHVRVAGGDAVAIERAARSLLADAVIYGTLDFDGNGYWNVSLTLLWWGKARESRSQRGVTFDIALRSVLEEAARTFSAHAPR